MAQISRLVRLASTSCEDGHEKKGYAGHVRHALRPLEKVSHRDDRRVILTQTHDSSQYGRRVDPMRIRFIMVALLSLVAVACATGSGGSEEPRRNRNLLTEEEMAPLESFTAWEAVQRLRPMWMRPGGIRNSANPAGHYPSVFVDGSPYGPMEILRTFRVTDLEEMRYISGSDATIRYGGDFQGGVILLMTKNLP
jgi:hypothetical protein